MTKQFSNDALYEEWNHVPTFGGQAIEYEEWLEAELIRTRSSNAQLRKENANQKEALEMITDKYSSVRSAMYISYSSYPIPSTYHDSAMLQMLKAYRIIAAIGLGREWLQDIKQTHDSDEYEDWYNHD